MTRDPFKPYDSVTYVVYRDDMPDEGSERVSSDGGPFRVAEDFAARNEFGDDEMLVVVVALDASGERVPKSAARFLVTLARRVEARARPAPSSLEPVLADDVTEAVANAKPYPREVPK